MLSIDCCSGAVSTVGRTGAFCPSLELDALDLFDPSPASMLVSASFLTVFWLSTLALVLTTSTLSRLVSAAFLATAGIIGESGCEAGAAAAAFDVGMPGAVAAGIGGTLGIACDFGGVLGVSLCLPDIVIPGGGVWF